VNGFRVYPPYLVKDLCDLIYELHPPELPKNNTLPASINMDFNGDEDALILGSTWAYHYWWKFPQSEAEVEENGLRRVTYDIIDAHFTKFFSIVRCLLLVFLDATNHVPTR